MNRSGVYFCKCSSAKTEECSLIFLFNLSDEDDRPNKNYPVLTLNVKLWVAIGLLSERHARWIENL